ncbi:MAG: toxin-antitoxin system TumE family protein [Microcoleaceae cyanobacterium]
MKLIEGYFQQLRQGIESCNAVIDFQLHPEYRTDFEGFVKGEITFKDGSLLYFREFVDAEMIIDRKMYSYQYMDASKCLIFRYDNADHKPQLNLPNLPHHKHEECEEHIVASSAPTLAEVLQEIEGVIVVSFR